MIEIRKVYFNNKEIKKTYFSNFSKKERMPFILMCFLSLFPNTRFISIYDKNIPVGYAYFGIGISEIFLMFIGIDEKFKQKGYGSKLLKYICNKYPKKCIVTTIGNRNNREFNKVILREKFYVKNGFNDTGYQIRIGKEKQEIFVCNKPFNRLKFSIFIILYSFLVILPLISKKNK